MFRFNAALFCAGSVVMVSAAGAQVRINHGNFDALSVGTAPDVGFPAGPWGFLDAAPDTLEADPSTMSIVSTSSFIPGASGNSLRLNAVDMPATVNAHVSNNFLTPYIEGDAQPLVVSFDLWIPAGAAAGGSMYVGQGPNNGTDRAAQLAWQTDGNLITNSTGTPTVRVANYQRDTWQSVRLEIDLVNDNYDMYYSVGGAPLELVGSNIGFRSAPLSQLTRITFVNFGGVTPNATSYLDNVVVIPAPAAGSIVLLAGMAMMRRRR